MSFLFPLLSPLNSGSIVELTVVGEYSIKYNISAFADATYNAFVAPLQDFTVTPSVVTNIA